MGFLALGKADGGVQSYSGLEGKAVLLRAVASSGEPEQSHCQEAYVSLINALGLPVDKSSKRICNA